MDWKSRSLPHNSAFIRRESNVAHVRTPVQAEIVLRRPDGAGRSYDPQARSGRSIEHDKATVWTIKLRKGVQFHDGKSLTADDVVYSLNRHKDPAVGSKAKALAVQMEEIKATGPLEVTIRLNGTNADLPLRPYDLEKAKFHLKKAGALDTPLEIVASSAATGDAAARHSPSM